MSLVYFMTRQPFFTIGEGEDGADVSVASYARTLDEALADVCLDANFRGDHVEISTVDFTPRSKLLLCRYGEDDCCPLVLLFTDEDPGPLFGDVAA